MSEMKSQKREASLINNTMITICNKGSFPKQETSHHVGMIEMDDFTQQITRVYSPTLIAIVDFHRFHYIVIKKTHKDLAYPCFRSNGLVLKTRFFQFSI